MTVSGQIRRRLFGVSSARSVFERDGFSPLAWTRFGAIAETLVDGYHAALHDPLPEDLEARLASAPIELRGIAWEGAGMGLAALDVMTPAAQRVRRFVRGVASNHRYPFYVGVGLAYARLRQPPERRLASLDPVLGWVTADGYGFHEAFFRRRPYPPYVRVPADLTSYSRRMFDQGVGRALWFSLGGDADLVGFQLRGFEPSRHQALWAGIGLASSYCGGSQDDLWKLTMRGAEFRTQLAVGAAIAAWGRAVAASPAAHTETACRIFCGRSAAAAAEIAERARADVSYLTARPAMAEWRHRIAAGLAESAVERRTPFLVGAGN